MNLTVSHRLGEYAIRFIAVDELLNDLPEPSAIITDRHVAKTLPVPESAIVLPAGEQTKSFNSYKKLIDRLALSGLGRNVTLVAVGGGVIGDLVGFAAATYLRGVRFIQVPTTLLAQVDSSVGGKVGIDLAAGKNLLGAFYPPHEVRLSVDVLKTLPPRQIASGMAEVLKYGFIMRPSVLDFANQGLSTDLIRACLECKIEVVQEDEFETTGRRAILNFGHTVAHAIEAELGYKGITHGEAVSIGMVAEAVLGEQVGFTKQGIAKEVAQICTYHKLPTNHGLLKEPERLIPWMKRDKKRTASALSFSVLKDIGACQLVETIQESDVRKALLEVGKAC